MSTSNSKGRGVLPITAAATRKPNKQAVRTPAPKLRLIIRRLPPGLTETEFWDSLGAEWRVGQGKVDKATYKPGKISKDLAKPSKPSRAYLTVKDSAYLDPLSQQVRSVSFQDAKNSLRDPCLIGPPSLEFAPYSRTPGGRVRHDGRQGTIDQDPEFIDFLQSLTEPITKPPANGESTEAKADKVTTTPLVQYIKEKKANKAKEKEAAATSKATKKGQDSKETKDSKDKAAATPKTEARTAAVKKGATSEAEKARIAKATQDAVTAINKSVAAMKGKTAPEKAQITTTTPSKEPTPTPQATPKRERQRGDASAAARIIGRDLGLTPKEGRLPRGARAASSPVAATTPAPASPSVAASAQKTTTPAPATPSPSQTPAPNTTPVQPPTGPRNLRNSTPQQAQSRPTPLPATPKSAAKPPPQPAPGAKSAFLKHANPSQGVTEELLRSTFSAHGTITRCEIDKKKGLGYIDFTDTEGLQKAMAASPVKVGNGSVVVLENRTPYRKVSQAPSRPGTASPIASAASSPKVTHATLASISEQVASQKPVTPSAATATASVSNSAAPLTTQAAVENSVPDGVAETPVTSDVDTATQPPAVLPTSPTTSQGGPPSAPRGSSRGGGRNHYRGGRGYRGRGGSYRGGNRAASANVPASLAGATQSTGSQAGAGTANTSSVPPSTSSGG
ncbi:hypothetical protein H2198_005159 [Neophaeococcomyces mojaviensis]|uniref:Uncharacterized protein n=1 Tax=Neophaeococcomyces mojaviensis TaxID=3383035 RepID=A0ACC3A6V5_9EURO|nr:hypothetical protein H2198_005159 [Knufia sp. JES_112]